MKTAALLTLLFTVPVFTALPECLADDYYQQTVKAEEIKLKVFEGVTRVAELADVRIFGMKRGFKIYLTDESAADFGFYIRQILENESRLRYHQVPQFKADHYNYSVFSVFTPGEPIKFELNGSEADRLELESLLKQQIQFAPDQSYFIPSIQVKRCLRNCPTGSLAVDITTAQPDKVLADKILSELIQGQVEFRGSNFVEAMNFVRHVIHYGLIPKNCEALVDVIRMWDPRSSLSALEVEEVRALAIKLYAHPMNLEDAVNWVDKIGLKDKLIAFAKSRRFFEVGTLFKKEPLRSRPLGLIGENAKDLGFESLTHSTTSLDIYLGVSSSPLGKVNGFISRPYTLTELAANGTGFYTLTGEAGTPFGQGAVADKNIRLRIRLLPLAKRGTDFQWHRGNDSEILILNGSAVEMRPNPVFSNALDYFRAVDQGILPLDNDVYSNTVRSRHAYLLNHLSESERVIIQGEVRQKLLAASPGAGDSFPPLIEEWFKWKPALRDPSLLGLANKLDQQKALKLPAAYLGNAWRENLNRALAAGFNQIAIQYYLSKPEALSDSSLVGIIDQFASNQKSASWVLEYILVHPERIPPPKFQEWMTSALPRLGRHSGYVLGSILARSDLKSRSSYTGWINDLIALNSNSYSGALYVLLTDLNFYRDAGFDDWMARAISKKPGTVLEAIRVSHHLLVDDRALKWLKMLLNNGIDFEYLMDNLMSRASGILGSDLFNDIMQYGLLHVPADAVSPFALAQAFLMRNPHAVDWIDAAFQRPNISQQAYHLLKLDQLKSHPHYDQWVDAYLSKYDLKDFGSVCQFFNHESGFLDDRSARWFIRFMHRYLAVLIVEGDSVREKMEDAKKLFVHLMSYPNALTSTAEALQVDPKTVNNDFLFHALLSEIGFGHCSDLLHQH